MAWNRPSFRMGLIPVEKVTRSTLEIPQRSKTCLRGEERKSKDNQTYSENDHRLEVLSERGTRGTGARWSQTGAGGDRIGDLAIADHRQIVS